MRLLPITLILSGFFLFFQKEKKQIPASVVVAQPSPIVSKDASVRTIAFGSCNKTNLPQDLWPAIVANKPDLWIWLGDIVYADTDSVAKIEAMYSDLKKSKPYQELLKTTPRILGVWDDHDYGANDGGKGFWIKKESRNALFDFLDVPKDEPSRQREGAYQTYTFGPKGEQVRVILLDTRYFRDTLLADETGQKRYQINPDGDVLGEEQWQWLEKTLSDDFTGLTLIGSSIQLLPDDHGYEKWGNFPTARRRFFSTLVKSAAQNVLIISGDRHHAELTKVSLPGLPYPLYEFTSSGMTHTRSTSEDLNRFREGDLVTKRNFGLLKLGWTDGKPVVTVQMRGLNNFLFQEFVLRY